MIKQSALTLVTPVKTGELSKLEGLLTSIRLELDAGSFTLFEDVGTIHYARFVVLKDNYQLSDNKASLLFSSDYDGNEADHLIKLATTGAMLIDQLYDCCEGYPTTSDRSPQKRKEYLSLWSTKPASFYIGAPGRDVQQIKCESQLRNYIWNLLHTASWISQSPLQIHRTIRENVLKEENFAWVKQQIKEPEVRWIPFLAVCLVALILLPILLPVVIIWLLIVHYRYEKHDIPLGLTPSQVDEAHVKNLEEFEDVHNQNQFTQIVPMRPGFIKLYTLKALMLFARFMVATQFRKGKLMGIPTIHFARWVMLDDNKQVLFFSNFDGSWQQYLGDFIDKSGWGLTAIFTNTKDFPKTRFLFSGGAYDEEHFLAWARYTQIPTAIWYCAYPHLSIKNINNNTAVRCELMRDLNDKQAQQFLNRF